jgi:hypothetical protein
MNSITPVTFNPLQAVPAKAPKPPADLSNPHLSADDILTENYFSMAALEQWLKERQAESRVLTVTACSVEYLFDPQSDPSGERGEWRPVLWFVETDTGLVINKTRSNQLRQLTGSPLLAAWAQAGQIAIKPAIDNGHAQIVIAALPVAPTPAPASRIESRPALPSDYDLDQANRDLFG